MNPAPLDNGRPNDSMNAGGARHHGAHAPRANRPPTVLVVSSSQTRRDDLTRLLTQDDVICGLAESAESALGMLSAGRDEPHAEPRFEVVVVDLPRCSAAALRFVRALGDRQVATVIVCPEVSFDEAVEAMRAGASDIVSSTIKPKELHKRVRCAAEQQRAARAGDNAPNADESGAHEHGVLRRVGSNHASRRDDADHADLNHDDARDAMPLPSTTPKARKISDLPRAAEPLPPAVIAEDFARLIRCELDVETLLRQALEFVLAHAGPTNAAVFLPGTSGDFSLGAYVNYTCPKDAAEVLLDHLANVAAPKLEPIRGVRLLSDPAAIREQIGEGADWIEDGHVLAFTCREKGECLAVFMLFREKNTPFTAHAATTLGLMSEAFGRQLSRVIRIHHRHLPRDQWGSLGDPGAESDDQGGMAA